MIAPTYLKKPENWQDFEKLCKKLWGEIWNCSDSIKRNGRNGQNQQGVDIYGKPKGENCYYGIQCKGKDDYTQSKLTLKEIDTEIEKAKSFQPELRKLIFATTANKDTDVEEYIRKRDKQNVNDGSFAIELFCWEDITDLLEERRETYNWYINNCKYKDAFDIEIYFNWKKDIEIKPKYVRTTKHYIKKAPMDLYENTLQALSKQLNEDYIKLSLASPKMIDPFYRKQRTDYKWCSIPINVKNIGSIVIEDFKLYLIFDGNKIEKLDDMYRSFNSPLMDQAAVVQENINRQKQREVFESPKFSNVIEFHPLKPVLVQSEHKTFTVSVKPKDGVNTIQVNWHILSRNYEKKGELTIKVIPEFEDKKTTIEVENECDLKPDEIIVEPKIIEK